VLRDKLENGIAGIFPEFRLNGHKELRLPNSLNVMLPGYRGESVVLNMDKQGIQFSSGSACQSSSPEPSHALIAMRLSEEEAHCSIRLSLNHFTTEDDIDYTIEKFRDMVSNSKHVVRFIPCR
jgi:cysteine sulfinate desulfinase/cysteine desulfurase-like protein